MKEGDVVLASLPQMDGRGKLRPALVLRRMPGYGDLLVYGISTQLHQEVADFDEIIELFHSDFKTSGLKSPSLIRLGFLTVIPETNFPGIIGSISDERRQRLLTKLIGHLQPADDI
jgi:mRNA interferase MazF